jgi:glycosyltransferase involved in cell wall biosynthesis
MRVALTNNFFPPRVSGSAHLTEELAKRLTQRGNEVLVVTTSYGNAPAEETRDGYRVVRLPSWNLPKTGLSFNFDISLAARPGNFRPLWRLLDGFAPDVLHQHGQFFDLTFMSSMWARRRKTPAVLSVHTRLEHPSPLYGRALAVADRTLVRAFVEMSRSHVVVMDTPMKEYIQRRYGVAQGRMVPIPVGIDPTRFEQLDRYAVRKQLGIADRPVVLSVGHVIPVRDRVALVEALPTLCTKIPDVLVVVVGNVYDDRFLTRAIELGVREHLLLTGSVPKNEVPLYMAAADVGAHDLQGYGLGTANLEFMAAGVPVVSVVRPDNFPGIQLKSGENIVIAPPDDPLALASMIAQLLDQPLSAARIGEAGKNLVREFFSLDVIVERHVELYDRLAAGE